VLFFAIVFIFTLLIWLDFTLGRRDHQKSTIKKEFTLRQSHIELFTTGENLFNSLFQDIQQASHHIHILFYIVREDELSQNLFSLLKKKAKAGVEVRLLVDRIGSFNISNKTIKDLKAHGVHFCFSQKPSFPFLLYKLNRRNHRKICVVDGEVGYLGGFNVGNEYLGLDPKLGHWRDFHLRVSKDGVQDLQQQFLEDWKDATSLQLSDKVYYPPLPQGDIPIKFHPTDGAHVEEIFLNLFDRAKKEITVGTPYYIPGKKIQEALIKKAKSGVKVTLLLPKKSDHLFVKEAAMPYMKPLIEAGCEVYQYTYGFYHAKIIIIDHDLCDIGTANFDQRSFYLNKEMNCFIYNENFIQEVKTAVAKDLKQAEKVTYSTLERRTFIQKVEEKIGTLLSSFL
jgi:cardiolipin synthase A/B